MIDDFENELLVAMLEDTFVETLRASEFGADGANKRMLRLVGLTVAKDAGPNSALGPGCVKTFFRPQKLHATGDDPRRHAGLSVFLLYRVRSQPGRNLALR